jgi:hypothetical protein
MACDVIISMVSVKKHRCLQFSIICRWKVVHNVLCSIRIILKEVGVKGIFLQLIVNQERSGIFYNPMIGFFLEVAK